MTSCILTVDAFHPLRDIISARKDLNIFVQISLKDNTLSFLCMDTYYLTQLQWSIGVTYPQGNATTRVSFHTTETNQLHSLLSNHVHPLLWKWNENTNLQILDANTQILLLTLSYYSDSCLQFRTNPFSEANGLRYVCMDLSYTLLNLCLINPIIQVKIENQKIIYECECEVGQAKICKYINQAIHEFQSRLCFRQIKVLTTLIQDVKDCMVYFENQCMHIVFYLINNQTTVTLSLFPYRYQSLP